jgi:hypothetical protein
MARLLTLSDDRVATETRQAAEWAELDRAWRGRQYRFAALCIVLYAAGTFLAFCSFGLTGPMAEMALWGGFFIGNGAILLFLLGAWASGEA